MRPIFSSVFVLFFFFACLIPAGTSAVESKTELASKTVSRTNSGTLPFTKNHGQWPDSILFRADAGGAVLWLTSDGIYYQFFRRIDDETNESLASEAMGRDIPGTESPEKTKSMETMLIKAAFVHANPNAKIEGEELLDYKYNYFLGNDRTKWRTNVPNYSAVIMKDIYPGIDIRFTGGEQYKVRYEIVADPDADLDQVQVAYEGDVEKSLDTDGNMIVKTVWGSTFKPIGISDNSKDVASPSLYSSDNSLGIVAANESTDQTQSGAVVLEYSTYLGGSADERSCDIVVDDSGSAYIVGYTSSVDFPTQSPYQFFQGRTDIFITRLSSSGNSLIFSTYLGGKADDGGIPYIPDHIRPDIAIDESKNVYVAGWTGSTDFPVQNAFQDYHAGPIYDGFITKISKSGDSLIYSTFLGGWESDWCTGIAVDESKCAYVTGITQSSNFPIQNPYQNLYRGGGDAFVTKLSSAGNGLLYSTFLGGASEEEAPDIEIDIAGNAYITGSTNSSDFPTQNPYQDDQNGRDAFLTKLSTSGDSLVYSTYLGGSGGDGSVAIAIDETGNAFVAGGTGSGDFPVQNPYQPDLPAWDAFVTGFSASGNDLVFSSYLGGDDADGCHGIAVDEYGNVYLTGVTRSLNFPTQNPYQLDYAGGWLDGFVIKLSTSGDGLIGGTYLGGNENDVIHEVVTDDSANIYITGTTNSTDFPTHNPYQTDQGYSDAFVAKLVMSAISDCGDVNGDESINIGDAVYLINYIFKNGPEPQPACTGDVNGDTALNVGDPVYLINYIFKGGPAPVPDCCL